MRPQAKGRSKRFILAALTAEHDGAKAHRVSGKKQASERCPRAEPLFSQRYQGVRGGTDDECQQRWRGCRMLARPCQILGRCERVSPALFVLVQIGKQCTLGSRKLDDAPRQQTAVVGGTQRRVHHRIDVVAARARSTKTLRRNRAARVHRGHEQRRLGCRPGARKARLVCQPTAIAVKHCRRPVAWSRRCACIPRSSRRAGCWPRSPCNTE